MRVLTAVQEVLARVSLYLHTRAWAWICAYADICARDRVCSESDCMHLCACSQKASLSARRTATSAPSARPRLWTPRRAQKRRRSWGRKRGEASRIRPSLPSQPSRGDARGTIQPKFSISTITQPAAVTSITSPSAPMKHVSARNLSIVIYPSHTHTHTQRHTHTNMHTHTHKHAHTHKLIGNRGSMWGLQRCRRPRQLAFQQNAQRRSPHVRLHKQNYWTACSRTSEGGCVVVRTGYPKGTSCVP